MLPLFQTGGGPLPSPLISLASYLPNAKIVDSYAAFTTPGAGSNNDIYTVPAGKRAILCFSVVSNAAVGTVSTFASKIKIGGTYYRLNVLSTGVAAGAGATLNGTAVPYIAEAGEVFAIEQTTNTTWFAVSTILEFDNTAALRTSKLLGTVIGDSVVYTPSGSKKGMLIGTLGLQATASAFYVSNPTGGTIFTFFVNYLRGATSASTSNRILASTSSSTNTVTLANIFNGITIGNGDSLSLNASAVSANAIIWVNILEF